MEQAIISGVAHDRSEAKITVVGVPDKPGEAAAIFEAVAEAEINIDMIVQNVSRGGDRPHGHLLHAAQDRRRRRDRRPGADPGAHRLRRRCSTTTRSARSRWSAPACAATRASPATFFDALAEAGVNIEMISTSEIRISVVTRADDVDDGRARRAHRVRPRRRRGRGRRLRRDRTMMHRSPSARAQADADPRRRRRDRRRRHGDARHPVHRARTCGARSGWSPPPARPAASCACAARRSRSSRWRRRSSTASTSRCSTCPTRSRAVGADRRDARRGRRRQLRRLPDGPRGAAGRARGQRGRRRGTGRTASSPTRTARRCR